MITCSRIFVRKMTYFVLANYASIDLFVSDLDFLVSMLRSFGFVSPYNSSFPFGYFFPKTA